MLFVLLLSLIPAGVVHGHGIELSGKYHEILQAEPYVVVIDFADWPLQAKKSNRLTVFPSAGIAQKQGTIQFRRPNGGLNEKITLRPYPGIHDGWVLEWSGLPMAGTWQAIVEVSGPDGVGKAEFSLAVAPPPSFPIWLGWVLGLTPLYGLLWFFGREERRVRQAIAADEGARA